MTPVLNQGAIALIAAGVLLSAGVVAYRHEHPLPGPARTGAPAGIRPGDIVLAVGGTPVKSVDELRAAAGESPRAVALLVQRGDARIFVPVRAG